PSAPHQPPPVLARADPQIMICPPLRTEWARRGRTVVVPGEKDDVVAQRRQRPGEALVHLLRVAAREVDAAATIDEQRVAGDQPIADEEALAARGMAGCVYERDL